MEEPATLNLLVVSMLYAPDQVGIAAIATDLCTGLAERGHEVTVYTAYPFYPEWKQKRPGSRWRVADERLDGVRVRRHWLYVPSRPSRLVPRLLHELSFPLSLARSLWDRRRYDATIVFCPLLGSVAFATLRKRLYREPLWLNVQDIPTEAGRNVGIHRSRLFHRAASIVQKFLFNQADEWSSISPEMVSQLQAWRSGSKPVQLCPNWLTGSLAGRIESLPSKVGARPAGPLRLLYCGTIGKKQGLAKFCHWLSESKLAFHLRIHGAGSEAESVRRLIASRGDDRFEFGGLLPEDQFVQALHDADLFLITEQSGAGFSFLPSKLIPSVSVGTPVLAVADRAGPLGREVAAHDLGLLLEWNELERLETQLAEVRDCPSRLERLQQRCVARAQSLGREAAIDDLEHKLRALAGQASRAGPPPPAIAPSPVADADTAGLSSHSS